MGGTTDTNQQIAQPADLSELVTFPIFVYSNIRETLGLLKCALCCKF